MSLHVAARTCIEIEHPSRQILMVMLTLDDVERKDGQYLCLRCEDTAPGQPQTEREARHYCSSEQPESFFSKDLQMQIVLA